MLPGFYHSIDRVIYIYSNTFVPSCELKRGFRTSAINLFRARGTWWNFLHVSKKRKEKKTTEGINNHWKKWYGIWRKKMAGQLNVHFLFYRRIIVSIVLNSKSWYIFQHFTVSTHEDRLLSVSTYCAIWFMLLLSISGINIPAVPVAL